MIQYLLTHPEALLLITVGSCTVTFLIILQMLHNKKKEVDEASEILDLLVDIATDMEHLKACGRIYRRIRMNRVSKEQLDFLLEIRKKSLGKTYVLLEKLKNDLEKEDNGFKR